MTTDLSALSLRATVSIHTPTQGVTFVKDDYVPELVVSIHTPTQGVTAQGSLTEAQYKFQSTHPRRV